MANLLNRISGKYLKYDTIFDDESIAQALLPYLILIDQKSNYERTYAEMVQVADTVIPQVLIKYRGKNNRGKKKVSIHLTKVNRRAPRSNMDDDRWHHHCILHRHGCHREYVKSSAPLLCHHVPFHAALTQCQYSIRINKHE